LPQRINTQILSCEVRLKTHKNKLRCAEQKEVVTNIKVVSSNNNNYNRRPIQWRSQNYYKAWAKKICNTFI